MEREQRLEAISLADADDLEALADEVLETLDIEVARGPSVGLLMVRAEEPSERLQFNFVEVTVSEAEVTARGQRGYAMVMGRFPEKALAGAILDVAVEVDHPVKPLIEETLRSALERDEARRRELIARVAPTRVRFEEMAS
ncbi:MAG TPA: phosphonate C-P lyase system protein PhnG [Dehalococcoidia bacterium]|nr:phosphonate C-P lyase system protein PhnG [Dehalococcoidia bacterium]